MSKEALRALKVVIPSAICFLLLLCWASLRSGLCANSPEFPDTFSRQPKRMMGAMMCLKLWNFCTLFHAPFSPAKRKVSRILQNFIKNYIILYIILCIIIS